MPKLIGAAAVILDSEGKVLLVKHSYGKNNWDLPGGKAEEDESAQETAKREVHEEVGLKVSNALDHERQHLFHTVGPRQ
ncbi:NUDIX hydrolase [Paenibacillus sp. MAH-36]|uniref:NUDIX hydrolase n=2 Tax=Paenibacillus TaxID=44249 RepID=A0ABU3R9D5_9BACL|nr:NUDIX hydrolase [Paenibacillus sp. PFR10]MDU0200884.1 NUDIX hydrolase [Paenibacillus sp. PFR10]